jgi:hypothetical protein
VSLSALIASGSTFHVILKHYASRDRSKGVCIASREASWALFFYAMGPPPMGEAEI